MNFQVLLHANNFFNAALLVAANHVFFYPRHWIQGDSAQDAQEGSNKLPDHDQGGANAQEWEDELDEFAGLVQVVLAGDVVPFTCVGVLRWLQNVLVLRD